MHSRSVGHSAGRGSKRGDNEFDKKKDKLNSRLNINVKKNSILELNSDLPKLDNLIKEEPAEGEIKI